MPKSLCRHDSPGAPATASPLHLRVCHDCGNAALHRGDTIPAVLCNECGSQDTRRVKAEALEPPRVPHAEGLVLTRRVGEAIEITHAGETLRIEVANIRGQRVGVRFLGPRSFVINRLENRRKRQDETPQDMEDDHG